MSQRATYTCSAIMQLKIAAVLLCQTLHTTTPSEAFVHPMQTGTSTSSHINWRGGRGRLVQPLMVATEPPTLTTQETARDNTRESVGPYSLISSNRLERDASTIVSGNPVFYDTTLRDGTQMEGISASVNDKLKIAKELHNFGEPAVGRWSLARSFVFSNMYLSTF